MSIYIVQRGDTVDRIAAQEQVRAEDIVYDNQLVYPFELAVGQALFIAKDETPDRSIAVGGYAYPYISPWVLRQTLRYLSRVHVFSYGFTFEGDLIPPLLGDEGAVIAATLQYGVAPILTLTPFGPDGAFNNRLIESVVNNENYTANLITQLMETCAAKGYSGIDIDFEYILASDRDAFTAFVKKTAEACRSQGLTISVALAPKSSADQKGLLYEGKDYRALGDAADSVLLMTYEWGYKYGPPLPVAPINQVRKVVEYAITEILPSKIDLGIPNYGYDWPLPFEQGVTAARTIGNIEAVRIAIMNDAVIQYDETAQSPYFTYTESESGVGHIVWFEDVRSIQAKFDLIREFGLRGCGYWTIMQLFRANWLLLASEFEIRYT